MIYGYARVSTAYQAARGNSLEEQKQELLQAGADQVTEESYTGTTTSRPKLSFLLQNLVRGDVLMVTKLDRLVRNTADGMKLIQELHGRGVSVHILNMGLLDDTPTGKLITGIMMAFAQFERDMIIERTTHGREQARKRPDYKDGRPRISKEQIDHALELLKDPRNTYNRVVKLTGISKSTLVRRLREQRAEKRANRK